MIALALLLGLSLVVTLPAAEARDVAGRADESRRLEAGEILVSSWPVVGYSLPQVKVIGVVKAPPEKVWAVVRDCANYKRTMPRTLESTELARAGNEVRCRVTIDMPFPFQDLWVETDATETVDPGRRYTRAWKLRDGDFRANTGSWTLEAYHGGASTLVTYEVLSEPKTALPKFIIKMAQEQTLPGLIEGLRKQLESSKP